MTQNVSKVCIVKYMGNRLWKWMTPGIYYLAMVAIICVALYVVRWFISAEVIVIALMGLCSGAVGKHTYDELRTVDSVPPTFILGILINLVVIAGWVLITEESLIESMIVMMAIMAFSPAYVVVVVVTCVHAYNVYRAAVAYCTPRDGEKV
jgi:hypothetical protein